MLPACVQEFLRYVNHPLEQAGAEDILRYQAYLQERPNRRRAGGLSAMMIHHHLYALRILFSYLEQTLAIRVNPMSGLHFPQPQHPARSIPHAGGNAAAFYCRTDAPAKSGAASMLQLRAAQEGGGAARYQRYPV